MKGLVPVSASAKNSFQHAVPFWYWVGIYPLRRKRKMLYDLNFWKAAFERAVKTFVQTLIAVFGTDQIGLLDMDWVQGLSLAASAAVLSILSSLGSANLGSKAGPSLVGETTRPETVIVEVTKPAAGKKTPAAKKPVAKKTPTTKK